MAAIDQLTADLSRHKIYPLPSYNAAEGKLFYEILYKHFAGLQIGHTQDLGGGNYAPIGVGKNPGELYLSDDLVTPLVWIWQSGQWNSLSSGAGPGPGPTGVLYKDFLLGGITEPYVGINYTPTFVGGQLTKETWVDSATNLNLKTIDYSYVGGVIHSEVIKVFDPADGVTIISQATNTYTFVGGILTGITKTRDI